MLTYLRDLQTWLPTFLSNHNHIPNVDLASNLKKIIINFLKIEKNPKSKVNSFIYSDARFAYTIGVLFISLKNVKEKRNSCSKMDEAILLQVEDLEEASSKS